MTVVDQDLLNRIVEEVVRTAEPEQVYVFGSFARGEACEDSDVDLLVVERDDFGKHRSRFQETNRIYKALSGFRIPVDLLLYSSSEFAKWQGSLNHVVGRCAREGKLLYERH
jgi:predicted nucleotidyltransferase